MIDTVRVDYKKPVGKEILKKIENCLSKAMDLKEEEMSNKLILQINKNYTSSSKEILELKLYVDNLMQEVGILYRIDNACDFKESLEENLKLYRAFICCLAYINYGTIEIYETKKDHKRKNLKISNSNKALTIYDCQDKQRLGNSRIEYRDLYIRNQLPAKEKIIKSINSYNIELKTILSKLDEQEGLLEVVDKLLIPEHLEHFYSTKTPYTVFEFIAYLHREGHIFTKASLEELLKKLNYKGQVDTFIREFRRRKGANSLDFITKSELKNLIKLVLEENKKTLKN